MSKVSMNQPKPWMDDRRNVSCSDLDKIISPDGFTMLPSRAMDEVYPRIYVGEHEAAADVLGLQQKGITHVLNTAHGKGRFYSNTSPSVYKKAGIKFLGISADDSPTFNLMPYFNQAADFISTALRRPESKVLVHCRAGVSRSATLVVAYLMLKQGMSAAEATKTVRSKREISPNHGFLSQLCKLEQELNSSREEEPDSTQGSSLFVSCFTCVKPRKSYTP